MTTTMEKATTKVKCVKSELGLKLNQEYLQVNRYELYRGFWIRTVLVGGSERNFEDDIFIDVK